MGSSSAEGTVGEQRGPHSLAGAPSDKPRAEPKEGSSDTHADGGASSHSAAQREAGISTPTSAITEPYFQPTEPRVSCPWVLAQVAGLEQGQAGVLRAGRLGGCSEVTAGVQQGGAGASWVCHSRER